MRKTILLILVLSLLLGAAHAEGDLLSDIQSRGKLVIATEGDWPPWTYHDKNNELVGLDVEIGALIAEGLGVEPEFQETAWDSILAGVDSGRFDIACNGVGYTEARAEKYSFSVPYVYTQKVLVVRGDNEDIQSVDDLEGRMTTNTVSSTYAAIAESYGASVLPVDTLTETIMMVEQGRAEATINAKGSVDDYLSEHPEANGATVSYANTLGETIALVEQGRVDATINARASIEGYLESHPEADIRIVQELPGDPVAYPMRKDDDASSLVAAVDEILAQARQDGTLAEISLRYFGEDRTRPE